MAGSIEEQEGEVNHGGRKGSQEKKTAFREGRGPSNARRLIRRVSI
jgi:hypothetical protein